MICKFEATIGYHFLESLTKLGVYRGQTPRNHLFDAVFDVNETMLLNETMLQLALFSCAEVEVPD